MRRPRPAATLVLFPILIWLTGCSTSPGETRVDASSMTTLLPSNTLRKPDGTTMVTGAQPASGAVSGESILFDSTGPHGMFVIGASGILGNSPSDVTADEITLEFFDPVPVMGEDAETEADVLYRVYAPPKRVVVKGFSSGNSSIITATAAQIDIWAGAIATLAPEQRQVIIEKLRAQNEAFGTAVEAAVEAILSSVVPMP